MMVFRAYLIPLNANQLVCTIDNIQVQNTGIEIMITTTFQVLLALITFQCLWHGKDGKQDIECFTSNFKSMNRQLRYLLYKFTLYSSPLKKKLCCRSSELRAVTTTGWLTVTRWSEIGIYRIVDLTANNIWLIICVEYKYHNINGESDNTTNNK